MPLIVHGVPSKDVHSSLALLINGMVNIKDTTGKFLMPLADGRIIDTKGWNDWEWTHGVGLYGLWQHHVLTGSPESLNIIEAWFRDRFAAGGTTKNINTMAAMLTLACLYEKTGEQTYLPHLDSWAEWAMHDLERTKHEGLQHVTYLNVHSQQLWADTLVMTCLPLAKIGLVLNRPQYVAEAKRQFLLHCQYLFDSETGMFFHGWQFYTDEERKSNGGKEGHNFARARWARGNSWITIAIPELIDILGLDPTTDPVAMHLLAGLRSQAQALGQFQTESGLWCTLLEVPESEGSYVEASATAGFAAGILKAIRMRLIPRESFEDIAVKAVKGVMQNISPEGELNNTSFGTAIGKDFQHYKDIPITPMPYGQAMAILALAEFLRLYI